MGLISQTRPIPRSPDGEKNKNKYHQNNLPGRRSVWSGKADLNLHRWSTLTDASFLFMINTLLTLISSSSDNISSNAKVIFIPLLLCVFFLDLHWKMEITVYRQTKMVARSQWFHQVIERWTLSKTLIPSKTFTFSFSLYFSVYVSHFIFIVNLTFPANTVNACSSSELLFSCFIFIGPESDHWQCLSLTD